MPEDNYVLHQFGSYRHLEPLSTRYSDQDSMGHINNVAYAAYMEAGRLAYLLNFMPPSQDGGVNYVLANLNINYLAEMHFPGPVLVGGKTLKLGKSSLTTGYGVFKDGICFATATCVNVHIDRETRKSKPIPAAVQQALRAELAQEPYSQTDRPD